MKFNTSLENYISLIISGIVINCQKQQIADNQTNMKWFLCFFIKKLKIQRSIKIKTGYLMEGTDLTAGIMQGVLSLSESENSSKCMLVFTDGESNWSYIDQDVIIKVAQKQKVELNVVGVGIDGEFLIPVAQDEAENFIYEKRILKLEAEELKNIAKNGGGIYTRINNSKQLKLDFNSLLGKSNLLLLDKEELIAPELVILLLQDANYRHQKTRKEYINIKDK